MNDKSAKHWADFYREFLIFFAIVFFTCVVGIIELLPEFENINTIISWRWFVVSLVYFGLLSGILYSLDKCFWLYGRNKIHGGNFAFLYPELEGGIVQKIFKKLNHFRLFLLFAILIVFILFYFVKVGVLY